MRKTDERTVEINLPFLNSLGSKPAPGALKYDVSEGSTDTGVACEANAE